MKKALLGAALLIAPFFSLANIFDVAFDGKNAATTLECDIGEQQPSQFMGRWNDATGNPKDYGTYHISGATGVSQTGAPNFINASQCTINYKVSFLATYYESDGSVKFRETQHATSIGGSPMVIIGVPQEVPTCQNLGTNADGSLAFPNHTYLGIKTDGTAQCFTGQDLADVDTCEYSSPWLPTTSTTPQFQCKKKPDGSLCRYEKKTANGQSWLQPALEPDTCFTGIGDDYVPMVPAPQPPVGNDCQQIGNGITACPENPANVCDANGLCQTGCGTVGFDGQEVFMCLSSDTDGDGLGDYADPDIDGDGIPNDQDLDKDGDGQEDPVYPVGQSNSQLQHQSNIEGLLSQIANNTSGGTGGNGQGASASEIGDEIGDELTEKLTEIGNFNTSSYEQSVDQKIQGAQSTVDAFLANDANNLTNAFEQTDFESSYSGLKSALTPNGCTADITIPFSNESLDLCTPASKAQPFLYVIFAIATFIYCMRRIQSTARND